MSANDGGPAFPGLQYTEGHGDYIPAMMPNGDSVWIKISPGMPLRDWIASKALQGMYSNPAMIDTFSHHRMMVEESLRIADEYLAARKRKEDA